MSNHSKTMQAIRNRGTRVAPAVALLLLGDSAYAGVEDSGDFVVTVPEPSTLGLLAAGAAVGGFVAWVRSRRRR